jgi:hypothetical protein
MSFRKYIERNYVTACEVQRGIVNDTKMIKMLREGPHDPVLVKKWMQDYGLFQGLTTQQREAVALSFLRFVAEYKVESISNEDCVAPLYERLFTSLHAAVGRSWTSATSKLLWCLFPHDIVIYDAFVHRSIVVMQCIDPDLEGFERIGMQPKVSGPSYIPRAVAHYMLYQSMVKKLRDAHSDLLSELREKTKETYLYDIRIIDKLLWMIGNAKNKHTQVKPNYRLYANRQSGVGF